MAADIYVALESFACEIGVDRYSVSAGELVRDGHPLIDAYAHLFEPVDARVTYEWETADSPAPVRRAAAKPKPKPAK